MKVDSLRGKKTQESPFQKRYKELVIRLFMLKELNNKLAKLIEKSEDRNLKRLKERYRTEFTNFLKLIGDEKQNEQSVLADRNAKKILDFLLKRILKEMLFLHVERISGFFVKVILSMSWLPTQFTIFVRDMGLVYLIIEFESFLLKN